MDDVRVLSSRQVLDHGVVVLVEHWGSDERIIESARMSTNKGFKGWGPFVCPACKDSPTECQKCKGTGEIPGDEKLLRYLWEHKHYTPFEMSGATFELSAPIMVFREWHRHRTQSYNEMSARYTPLPDVNYTPTMERVLQDGGKNKQAQAASDAALSKSEVESWLSDLQDLYARAQWVYERGLRMGVPKELARLPVPVGRYSKMRASANLRNWLGFLTLRMDTSAQWEIRQYADTIHDMLARLFPRTLELFDEHRS